MMMDSFMQALPGQSIHNPASPTHFMWLQPARHRISIFHRRRVLAVSSKALRVIEVGRDVLEPVLYLPKSDLRAVLKENGKTSFCPLKGDAFYFDLLDATGRILIRDAAWTYPAPFDFAASLKDHFAFDRPGIVVEATLL